MASSSWGHSYIGNSGAVLWWSFMGPVSTIIMCTYLRAIWSSFLYFPTISSRYMLYTMLRYLDVNGKNKWTVVRQVYRYCGYILLHQKSDSIYNECIYSTQSTQPSWISITSVDISRKAPRKFIIGGGRTAGRIDGLLWGISCSWRMSHLRWIAKCVNAMTPSEVRCQNTSCTLSLLRALVGNIGDNVMQMQCAQYRGFNAWYGRSHFFITESAAISDRHHAHQNF